MTTAGRLTTSRQSSKLLKGMWQTMSNIEIIEMQNTIISNMAQINAELHMRLSQFEAVAQSEKVEALEAENEAMLERLKSAGVFEEGGNL